MINMTHCVFLLNSHISDPAMHISIDLWWEQHRYSDNSTLFYFEHYYAMNTHFIFYKNIVYKNVKPQLWGYLKNIFIAETAFSSNFNAFLRTNTLFWYGWDLKILRTLEPQQKLLVLIKKKVRSSCSRSKRATGGFSSS